MLHRVLRAHWPAFLEMVVAFSCKKRGFCPSCVARRTSDAAAHLVDDVLPEVPTRQRV